MSDSASQPPAAAEEFDSGSGVAGRGHISTAQKVLETGASMVQDFTPLKNICAYLNAFHIYQSDPSRLVEAQHYCSHISNDVRQCLIYDSGAPNARLIGVEYMISKELYETLEPEEKKLWHSHAFEVMSGMLIMPKPRTSLVPDFLWDKAETREMEEVVSLYGKTFHFWEVDKGHNLPLGMPKLMMSFVKESPGFEKAVADRDSRFGTDRKHKAELRKHIQVPEVHPEADQWDHSKQA
ncbi:hypothetical protein FN846DRAFT_970342 [Sphaerosporella brunnea]|uniref:DUF1264-domain-containing protein n=1 Tax=Sphaerosporella brunnea TaxID=1250544 RepID=A0A5J5EJD5_9PEZI|nr:hypothetical protein FN846DRAFT_970342 [Sphaerosporella brunnea]